jgi:hypothetical protein
VDTANLLAAKTDEELVALGYSPDTIQQVRGFSVQPLQLQNFVAPNTADEVKIEDKKKPEGEEKKSSEFGGLLSKFMGGKSEEPAAEEAPAPEMSSDPQPSPSYDVQAAPQQQAPAAQPNEFNQYIAQGKQAADTKQYDNSRASITQKTGDLASQKQLLQQQIERDMKGGIPEEGIKAKYGREMERINKFEKDLGDQEVKHQQLAQQLGLSPDEYSAAKEVADSGEAELTPEENQNFGSTLEKLMVMQNQQKSADLELQKLMVAQDRKIQDLMSRKIDPDRFWKNKTGGEKTRMFWGIMLSQKGGSNAAMQHIDNQIARDVAAQKSDIENEIRALSAGNDKMKIAATFAKKGTVDTRAMAHRLNLLDATIEEGRRLSSKPKANQEQYANALNQLQMMRQQTMGQLADALSNGAKLSDEFITADTPSHLMAPEQKARHVPGYGLAKDKVRQAKFTEYAAELGNATNGLRRALALSEKANKFNPLDPNRVKLEGELVASVGALRLPYTGPGPLLEAEYQRLKDVIGNPNKIMSLPHLEKIKLQTALEKLQADVDEKAKLTFDNYKPKSQQFSSFKPTEE